MPQTKLFNMRSQTDRIGKKNVDNFFFHFYCWHGILFHDLGRPEGDRKVLFAACQNVCEALSYLLDNIYFRFRTNLYRQIVGIPMGTNCAPLVADLFLYCYETDFIDSFNHNNQSVSQLDF